MKIFLSWSGPRSKQVAIAFEEWLQQFYGDADIFSSLGIDAGENWSDKINHALSSFDFGILFLTPENLSAPWILFEAGALANNSHGIKGVVPYLFGAGIAILDPPLSQFHAATATENGTLHLIRSISNAFNKTHEVGDLEKKFEEYWPSLQQKLLEIQEEPILKTPKVIGLENESLFNLFYENESQAMKSRLDQLHDGYLQIFSKDVERLEDELFEYMKKQHLKLILAVDLSFEPQLLSKRTKRDQRRQQFIYTGGEIRRIFVVDDDRFKKRKAYRRQILQILQQDMELNVAVGIQFLSKLENELIQDFILYDRFAVIVEAMQADESYGIGKSIIYFKRPLISEYRKIFSTLEHGAAFPPAFDVAPNLIKLLMKEFDEGSKFDFEAASRDCGLNK